MKFLHMADIHLGCRRYNLEERTFDFYRAWIDVIKTHAIPNKVDFVLSAGDFFDRRNIDPAAMDHAKEGLALLRAAGIPFVAIEGNHDQHESIGVSSWLRSLAKWGDLILLEPVRDDEGKVTLVGWDQSRQRGSYVDIAGARIFGSYWYGASTGAAIPVISDAIRRANKNSKDLFSILLLHTDVEGQLNRPIPALSVATLKELQANVDYVALGHTHKKFEIDNWAFNPGSLEACTIDEYREVRGVFLVEVSSKGKVKAKHITDYQQRPFLRIGYDVTEVEDTEKVYAGVMELVDQQITKHTGSDETRPIIELTLRGQLGFKNSLLKINKMRDDATKRTGALHVIMRNQSVPVEYALAAGADVDVPRHEREQRIITDIIRRDNMYKPRAKEMAELVIESKRLALSGEAPDKILELIAIKLDSVTTAAA